MIFFNQKQPEQAICYATDTRLMGVVGASIEYKAEGHTVVELYHIDFESYGVDRYEQFVDGDSHAIKEMKQEAFGGLGGKLIRISLELFFQLIYEGCSSNVLLSYKVLKQEIFQSEYKPSDEAHLKLMAKICVPMKNAYHSIHYYLMRIIGQDAPGARYLSTIPVVTLPVSGLMVRNQIDELGKYLYRTTSVVSTDDLYYLITLCLRLDDDYKINEISSVESMEISDFEVALMVKKKEFISVYEIFDLDFEQQFLLRHKHCMVNLHENGRLITEFKINNDHVTHENFLLSDDIERVYFMTDDHQLLVMAYAVDGNEDFENHEAKLFSGQLQLLELLEFEEPILYDFVDSGFDDFIEFLESL